MPIKDIISLCKQIAVSDEPDKFNLIKKLDQQIEEDCLAHEDDKDESIKLKIGSYAIAGLFEEVEKLNSTSLLSIEELLRYYAIGGHYIQVEKYKTPDDLNDIAEAYAMGGHDDRVIACIREGASISRVAAGYATVGRHDKVKFYLSCGASALEISKGYKRAEDEKEEAEYYKNLSKQPSDYIYEQERSFLYYKKEKGAKTHELHKLRINVTKKTYENNKKEISSLIMSLAKKYPSVISSFKYIIPRTESLYAVEKDFWEAVKANDAKKTKQIYKENEWLYNQYPEISNARRDFCRNVENISKEPTLTKVIEAELKTAQLADKSYSRLMDQAQFTLYLYPNYSSKNLQCFVKELNDHLKKAGFVTGNLDASDVLIHDFISLRQQALSDNSSEYISAFETDTATIEKLKSEARESLLYKILTKETSEDKKQEVNPRTIALLDVDDTISFGGSIVGASHVKTIEDYEKHVGINTQLLKSMFNAGIKDIYLFTDMTIDISTLSDRHLLIKYLQKKGFTVHGVVTPPDIFFNRLTAEEASKIRKEIKEEKDIESYVTQKASKILARKDNNGENIEFEPGKMHRDSEEFYFGNDLDNISFSETLQKLSNETYFRNINEKKDNQNTKDNADILDNKATVGKHLVDFEKPHSKGPLFGELISSKSFKDKGFTSVFYADDNLDAVNSVAAQANKNKESLPVSILHWPKGRRDGFYPVEEQHIKYTINRALAGKRGVFLMNKENALYMPDLLKSDKFVNACDEYIEHLKEYDYKNSNCLAGQKFKVVNDMRNELVANIDKSGLKIAIDKFENSFNQNKELLEKRRDSGCRKFLKVVLTIFTFGIAAACGLWKIKGEQFARKIKPRDSKPPSLSNGRVI